MMTLPIFSEKLNPELAGLITRFNAIAETDHLQRLFYLQKIDYSLKNYNFNDALLDWVSSNEWKKSLRAYSINEIAAIFLKSMQFAQAVAKHAPKDTKIEPHKNMYKLFQARDLLLKSNDYETCKDQYISFSLQLNKIAEEEVEGADNTMEPGVIREKLTHLLTLLQLVKGKIEAIQGKPPEKNNIAVTTTPLGPSGNNANFIIKLVDQSNPGAKPVEVISRAEDRDQLRLEHELHSFPVAEYFNMDFAFFMMKLTDADGNIDFRPVVLSGKANQGSLDHEAKKLHLKKEEFSTIHSACKFYFTQLIDFQEKLLAAQIYHPDIKLTNFLVHNNLIRVSDRKTFLNEAKPFVNKIRTTVVFATDEYRSCLNGAGTDYLPLAKKTQIDMPEFMAYQLGMALKHFLILTQLGENPTGPEMRNGELDAASYFKSPSKEITNLWLLARGLTHPEPQKRLSLANFKELLKFTKCSEATFYEKVREIAPSITPDLTVELRICNNLLKNTSIGGKELISKANLIFSRLLAKNYDEDTLQHLTETLAVRCYNDYAESFKNLLTLNNWNAAPWYRKMLYWVSFGYWDVDPAKELDTTLFKNIEPELIPLIRFLPKKELNILGGLHNDSFCEAITAQFLLPAKPGIPTAVISAKQKISATLPLKKGSGQTLGKPQNNVPDPEPLPIESTSESGESNNGAASTVFKADAPAAPPIPTIANNHHLFFNINGRKVYSVNTAMAKGDGSNRIKRPPAIETNDSGKPRLWDIFTEIDRPNKKPGLVDAAVSKSP